MKRFHIQHSEAGCWSICEACAKPIMPGQVVHPYNDVGEVHVDCDQPYKVPADDDKAMFMLGDPMRHVPVSTPAKAGEDGVKRAHAAFVLAAAKIERGTRLDSLTTDEEMALVKAVVAALHGDQEG